MLYSLPSNAFDYTFYHSLKNSAKYANNTCECQQNASSTCLKTTREEKSEENEQPPASTCRSGRHPCLLFHFANRFLLYRHPKQKLSVTNLTYVLIKGIVRTLFTNLLTSEMSKNFL